MWAAYTEGESSKKLGAWLFYYRVVLFFVMALTPSFADLWDRGGGRHPDPDQASSVSGM
jgi:hypothetical protein